MRKMQFIMRHWNLHNYCVLRNILNMKGERIASRQSELRIKTSELLEGLSIMASTLSRWKNNINEPNDATKIKLADLLHTSVAYLMGETDDPNPSGGSVNGGTSIPANGGKVIRSDKLLMIPHISPEVRVSAGTGNAYEDIQWNVIDRYPVFDGLLLAIYGDDDLTCITVEGDSMEPQIHDGDVVIFNHAPDWVSGNIYVVCHNGLLLVKGLISDGFDKPPILRSINKEYSDIKIKEGDFFLVYGRVLKIDTTRKPKPVI